MIDSLKTPVTAVAPANVTFGPPALDACAATTTQSTPANLACLVGYDRRQVFVAGGTALVSLAQQAPAAAVPPLKAPSILAYDPGASVSGSIESTSNSSR